MLRAWNSTIVKSADRRRAERKNSAHARWDRAVNSFTRLADLKGTRADAALYWKAYAQNRLGQRADALTTISELTKGYPNSRYLKEARALELEVRNAAGQPVRPEAQADEDLKLMALGALANSDPTTAIPIAEQILNGSASPRLKERALYVLAQMNTPKSREILTNVAKGGSIPELQSKAIQYLGAHGGRESRAALANLDQSFDAGGAVVRGTDAILSPGLRYAINRGDLQIVPGVALPIRLAGDEHGVGLFFYLSFEHPYKRAH